MNRTAPTVGVKDALELERNEQIRLRNRHTRRAIEDTYGPKQATKKRRKLPGKRTWKDKRKQYAKLQAHMTLTEFNAKQKQQTIITRLFKQNNRHRLQD